MSIVSERFIDIQGKKESIRTGVDFETSGSLQCRKKRERERERERVTEGGREGGREGRKTNEK